MIVQYLVITLMICWALGYVALQLRPRRKPAMIRGENAPPSLCGGCSGCASSKPRCTPPSQLQR